MIHVDFQKRGLGTALTRYTNTIADKTGVRTWAPARPTSIKMFLNEGFTLRGEIDAHLERWGGDREKSISKMVCRDPPA
jgi:L-amino acid N-acyltransferase YncA